MTPTRYGTSGGGRLLPAFLCTLLLMTLPGLARAQGGTVAGEVADAASGQPINGAQVVVEGVERGTVADGRGRFLIPGVPAGTYTVRVQYIGYRTARQEVTVVAGQTAQVRFELTVSAIALNEVVVTGTAGAVERRKLGNSVGSVNVSQVQELVPVATVGQALQARIPGVRSIGTVGGVGASRDLRIRGKAPRASCWASDRWSTSTASGSTTRPASGAGWPGARAARSAAARARTGSAT